MEFGPVQAPRGADFGSASANQQAGAGRSAAAQSAQGQTTASQAAAAGRPEVTAEMRTVGDVQRLAGFLRTTAEEVAAEEAGTQGEGSGAGTGGDLEGGVMAMMTQVERHAERVFRSILEFAGDDRKLLEQARGFVNKVFEEFRERQPEPMMARLTHERVIDLIEARLRGMDENQEVDFSA